MCSQLETVAFSCMSYLCSSQLTLKPNVISLLIKAGRMKDGGNYENLPTVSRFGDLEV